eukprot:1218887-Amphidinium_carterae.1
MAAAPTTMGTSPKRQPKKPASTQDDIVGGDLHLQSTTSGVASKRARSADHSGTALADTAMLSDSSKLKLLDDLWRNFGRMFELVEQHSRDMQQHGHQLADLRDCVAKLETKQ